MRNTISLFQIQFFLFLFFFNSNLPLCSVCVAATRVRKLLPASVGGGADWPSHRAGHAIGPRVLRVPAPRSQ